MQGSLAFCNNRVFAGVYDSETAALDAITGDVIRKYSKSNNHVYGLVVTQGRQRLS